MVRADRVLGRGSGERLALALFGVRDIFGTDLPQDPRFVEAVVDALRRLYADGAKWTVMAATQRPP